jgi:hypothetical protein
MRDRTTRRDSSAPHSLEHAFVLMPCGRNIDEQITQETSGSLRRLGSAQAMHVLPTIDFGRPHAQATLFLIDS